MRNNAAKRQRERTENLSVGNADSASSEALPIDLDGDIPLGRATHKDTRLGFLMHDISRLRRSVFDQLMKAHGVTRAQWWVIVHLARHDGMMQVQLADMLDIGKASLGNLVERLEKGGWVDRRVDPIDARVKRVFLKRKARLLIREMQKTEENFNERSLNGLGRSERDLILMQMEVIKANLLQMSDDLQNKSAGSKV